jgi:hypothetical protein
MTSPLYLEPVKCKKACTEIRGSTNANPTSDNNNNNNNSGAALRCRFLCPAHTVVPH